MHGGSPQRAGAAASAIAPVRIGLCSLECDSRLVCSPVFSASNLRKAFEYAAVEVGLDVWRDPGNPYYGGYNIVDSSDPHMAMERVQDLVTSSLQVAAAIP
jgi:hypothetical protein